MKKLISLCVAFSMLLCLTLAACGPAEQGRDPTESSGEGTEPPETDAPLPENPYDLEALAWAAEFEIADPQSALDDPCTQEKAVTLLWRAAGFQAPAKRILWDPDEPDREQRPDAIAWAEQRGVTWEGWSPEAPCTRAVAVTLLWRRAGCPEAEADAAFSDVPAGAEVFPALSWAAARGIVESGGDFGPDEVVTQGDLVTLLWRARAMFTPDAVGRAKLYGYVPEELWEDPDRSITMAELCELIGNIIAWHNAECLDAWEDIAAEALASDDPVHVDEALVAFVMANAAMGLSEDLGYTEGGLETTWGDISQMVAPDKDWWEGCRYTYPMFKGADDFRDPNWEEPQSEMWLTMQRFGQSHISLVDMSYMFPHGDDWSFHFGHEVTCREAIRAATVWAESDVAIYDPAAEYVSFEDAGTYDTTIITPELLAAPSDLPEATRTSLPGGWRGMGISKRKDVMKCYRQFKESDIRVLAENGFNFTKLFFDLNTLKFPYKNQEAGQVNLEELRDLDRLVAWCIQYGVHLQISCNGFAGYSSIGNWLGEKRMEELPMESWEEFVAIWGMLAKRYAGIPSKYLSFELIGEWIPNYHEEEAYAAYTDCFFRAADAIWAADPERVVFDSTAAMFDYTDVTKWLDLMAGHGIALGIHPYYPDQICVWDEFTVYPDDPQWPIPWFPSGVESGGEITIEGDLGGGTLTVYFAQADWPTQVYVLADGKPLEELDPTYIMNEIQSDIGSEPFVKGYDIQIPAGVTRLTFKTGDQKVWYNGFKFTRDGAESGVMVNDYRFRNLTGESHFTVDENGWRPADGRMFTMEDIYQAYMEPIVDIAQKYGVGVMVNEMGCFGSDIGAVQAAYLDDLIAMLEEKGIGWCYCDTRYAGIFDVYRGEGDEMAIYHTDDITHRTYECADGHLEEYWYRNDLMDVFHKYTLTVN